MRALLSRKKTAPEWKKQIIELLNLQNRLTHQTAELAGGQQQRVAVARGRVAKPALLVADEPTGNQDSCSSMEVLKLLREAVNKLGQTVVMVTHDARAASVADRVLVVRDGQVTQELNQPSREELAQVI